MINGDMIIGIVVVVVGALFSNVGIVWWRIGKLEGKVDILIKTLNNKKES